MDIATYLDREGLTVAEFAEMIGVHRTAAYRYRTGDRLPEPHVILRIRDATLGAVLPDDLYEAWEARGRAA